MAQNSYEQHLKNRTDLLKSLDVIADMYQYCNISEVLNYLEQISYLLCLKLLNDNEQSDKSKQSIFPNQASRFQWRKWAKRDGLHLANTIDNEVFPYMASLVREAPWVADFFQEAKLEINNHEVLKKLITAIDAISFDSLNPEDKSGMLDYLIESIGPQKLYGEYLTPKHIRQLMVQLVNPKKGDRIFDPAFGMGGLLIDAVQHIIADNAKSKYSIPIYGESWLEDNNQTIEEARAAFPNLQTYERGLVGSIHSWQDFIGIHGSQIHGYDISKRITRLALLNFMLIELPDVKLHTIDALGESHSSIESQYDVIISNPPMNLNRSSQVRSDLIVQNSKQVNVLFLSLIMQSLSAKGRSALLVPPNLLFTSTDAHIELRRLLVTKFDLQAVIYLKGGVFRPYTSINTAILVFRKQNPDSKHNQVLYYEINHDGYGQDKNRTPEPDKNDIPELLNFWKQYIEDETQPSGPLALSQLPAGSPEAKYWFTPYEVIIENNYNLEPERYKPFVAESLPDEDPMFLLDSLIDLEQSLLKDLEALKKDLALEKSVIDIVDDVFSDTGNIE